MLSLSAGHDDRFAQPPDPPPFGRSRHLIENFFADPRIKSDKQFRAIATRYDKTARNFLAAVHLTAAVIWLN